MANPATSTLPESAPPTARTRIAPTDETRPPTRRAQLAKDVSAPCFVKRRNVKAVPNSGPATGTDTASAFAA
jgi:hypothetical protein